MNTFGNRFSLTSVQFAGGEETPMFSATFNVMKNGEAIPIATVRNGGRGGQCFFTPIDEDKARFLFDKLGPAIQKYAIAKEPQYASLYSKSVNEALSGFAMDLFFAHMQRDALKAQIRQQVAKHPVTEGFRIGQTVRFGRKNGEKTLGKVVKVNRKSLKVQILENRGSKSPSGEVWRVAPGLCEVVR